MITLAFDTCLDKMYVVLKQDNRILASKIVLNQDNKYHSAFLLSRGLSDYRPTGIPGVVWD